MIGITILTNVNYARHYETRLQYAQIEGSSLVAVRNRVMLGFDSHGYDVGMQTPGEESRVLQKLKENHIRILIYP